jgi:trans-feruloyl-CoA hydratase/vanillin synthase
MTHPTVQTRQQGAVLTLTLLSPPASGVQIGCIEALAQIFDELPARTDVRVVILDGNFDWPLDTSHWQALRRNEPVRTHRALQQMQRWRTAQLKVLPQALMAVVTGPCMDAALTLIEGCDLALCSENATLGLSAEQAIWLGPETEAAHDESAQALGASLLHAMRDQRLTAQQAQDAGWVTLACPARALDEKVHEITQSLLDKDPLALQFAKETLAHVPHMNWDASVNYTAAKFAEIKARQAQAAGPSSRANAIAGFLAGQSKPGLRG